MSTDDPLDDALHSLDRPAGKVPWREPDDVRRIARRRAITRRSALGVAALAVAAGVTDALLPSSSTPTPPTRRRLASGLVEQDRVGGAVELVADVRPLPTTANDITPVATAAQQFALDLLRAVPATDTNVVLSPSSLATALAMLQLGAAGTTRDEIAHVLHTDHLSSQQQALGWAALTKSLAETGVLESANSLWQQQKFPLVASYMARLARYFDTGVWQVDFQGDMSGAMSAINAWCSDQTHGKITKLFEPGSLDPSTTKLVLANAEYFKASWHDQFDPKKTSAGTFHRSDGSRVSVAFMSYNGRAATTATSTYFAAQVPYAGERFAAQIIKPQKGSLDDLTKSITPATLEAIARAEESDDADFLLPRFVSQTFTDLGAPLARLGMPTAFTPDADFSLLSPVPLEVEAVVQRDYLKVDEVGTVAAAVTGVGIEAQSTHLAAAFDAPFLFLVRDTQTGVILFAGQIVDPSAG